MKELILIRHAKSDWGQPGLDDHDRPLNERGLRDAPRIGAALAQRGVRPTLLVSSTATRAVMTAELVAGELGLNPQAIQKNGALYLPRPDEVLKVVRNLDEGVECAALFGHNPGFHETAWQMARPDSADEIDHFPTCCVARFRLPIEFWGAVEFGEGELVEHLYPKKLDP